MKRFFTLLLIILPELLFSQKIGVRTLISSMNQTVTEFTVLLEKNNYLPILDSDSPDKEKTDWTKKTRFGKHKLTVQIESYEDNNEIIGKILLDFSDNLAGRLMNNKFERRIKRRCDYLGSNKMAFLYKEDVYYQTHIHPKTEVEFRLFIFEGHEMISVVHHYKGDDF